MEKQKGYMDLLRSRGVFARGFFQIGSDPAACYGVTRGGALYGLDLEPAALGENEIWEQLEQIRRISKEEFEAAQEQYWDARRAARGAPTNAQLQPLAARFAAEYAHSYALGRWKTAAGFSEETLRRIAARAAALLAAEKRLGPGRQKKLFRRMFADLARARAERMARGPGSAFEGEEK